MKRVIKHPIFQLSSASIFTQIGSLILIPAITRLYAPEAIGELSLLTSYSAVALGLVFFQADRILVSEKTEKIPNLIGIGICFSVLMSIVFFLLLVFFKSNKIAGFALIPFELLIWFIPFLAAQSSSRLFRTLAIRNSAFKTVAGAQVASGLSVNILKVIAGLFRPTSFCLLFSEMASWILSAIILVKKKSLRVRWPTAKSIKDFFVENWNFIIIGQFSNAFYAFSQLVPIQILSSHFGLKEAGLFSMALRIGSLPISHFGMARSDFFQNQLGKMMFNSAEPSRILSFLRRNILRDIGMGFAIYLTLTMVGTFFVGEILGKRWEQASQFIPVLSIWLFFAYVVSPYSQILTITKRNDLKFIYDISTFILLFGLWVVQVWFKLSSIEFIWLLSLCQAATYIVYAIVIMHGYKNFIKMTQKTQ